MTRLALVGYGRIAPKHLEAFRALGCEFVACCNRSGEGRRRAQTEGGIPNVYGDVAEMLTQEQPAGVVCCTSLDQVYSAALKILPFGIPTLLEKPPGTSLPEYDDLCATAVRYGTPVMVGLNRPHYSVLQRAIADAGGLEAVTSVAVDWSEDPRHCLGRGLTPTQVERMIFGNSLHGLHLLTTLAGELRDPQITTRDLSTSESPFRWIMSLQGVSTRGVLAFFTSTWDAPAPWRLVFNVAGRRYAFAPLETCQVQTAGVKELRTIDADEIDRRFKAGFHRQSEVFLQAIAERRVPSGCDLKDCRPAMDLAARLTGAFKGDSVAGRSSSGD